MAMLRPIAHEIEDAAERIFADQLPRSWVTEPVRKDYGIDFRVDTFEAHEKTGITIGVQLKGVRKPLVRNGRTRFSIDVRHLAHYVDNERQPIYLIVVDVTERKGYWIHLQRYAIESLKRKRWRLQRTVTIEIPLANTLTDTHRLNLDIHASDTFMCSFRPGALPVSYNLERCRLTSIDPRFDFELSGKNGQLGWLLSPREPVELKLKVDPQSESARRRLELAIEGHEFVQFKSHEISIVGSPLFDGQEFDLSITTRRSSVGVSVNFSRRLSGVDNSICCFPGKLSGSKKKASVVVPSEKTLLEWKFSFDINPIEKEASVTSSLEIDFESWIGRNVLSLPYFAQTIALARAVQDGADIDAKFSYQGNPIFAGQLPNSSIWLLGGILEVLVHVEHLRRIATASGATIVFPRTLGDSDESDAQQLSALIENGGTTTSSPRTRLSARLPRAEVLPMLEKYKLEKHLMVKIEGPREYRIGELTFRYSPCAVVMTHMVFPDATLFESSLAAIPDDEVVQLELAASQENELSVDCSNAELTFEATSTSP